MKRPLPTAAETAEILGRKRTRPARRPPPPLGRQLTPFLKALDARFGQGPGALIARWPEIVGVDLACRTEPVKLTRPRGGGPGSLELRAAPGAALIIQHQGADILSRVNLFMGAGAVGKLRIVQGPVKPRLAPSGPAQTSRGRRKLKPLDAGAEAELEKSVSGARNDGLREALFNLGKAVTSANS